MRRHKHSLLIEDRICSNQRYERPVLSAAVAAAWRIAVLCLAFWVGVGPGFATAQSTAQIGVIYPDLSEPYRSVFARIIEGIEDQTRSKVVSFPVTSSTNPHNFSSELKRQNIRVVITLGRQGLKIASTLSKDIGIVAGGVVAVPESEAQNFPVHSLAPDPALLFARLKILAPGIKRILVVYDPHQNDWLIRLAQEAANARGLELVASPVTDVKAALRTYNEILASADPRKDALWLPQDSTTVEETSVLPLILRETWNRNLVFFSSSVLHVKRGALFSLYPDNLELGRSLASEARQIAAGKVPAGGVAALKNVLVAVNVRTASHLGINLESKRQSFDLVFPEQ